jgi:hypothetical protein
VQLQLLQLVQLLCVLILGNLQLQFESCNGLLCCQPGILLCCKLV